MSDIIYDICIPWIQKSYVDPVTGKEIDEKGKRHRELRRICYDHINFDLLKLTELDETVTQSHLDFLSSKAMVSFQSILYLTEILKAQLKLRLPFNITKGDSFKQGLGYGLYWDIKDYSLHNCKLIQDRNFTGNNVVFINIVNTATETLYGCHALIVNKDIWERVAPVGAPVEQEFQIELMDTRIKRVFQRRIKSYYMPTSCPINNCTDELCQLYCEIWDMWYLYDRIKNKGYDEKWREQMYPVTVGRTLAHPEVFTQFLVDYLRHMQATQD